MDESEERSTNVVDQLLGHTRGPAGPITDRDVKRTRSSAYIVHGNFRRLVRMCDDITVSGLVAAKRGSDDTDVTNEVYRRVHNYVSSLYSFNEQVRDVLCKRLDEVVEKRDFLPERNDHSAPAYTRRLTFLWGIRNDFQHGDYWCLAVEHETTRNGYDYYHLYFRKQYFNATPEGSLDTAGDYLAHAPDDDQRYPLPYVGEFHRTLFSEFEQDFEAWCGRNRT
jgi:hypothetical protein